MALTDRQWFGDGMGIAVRKGDKFQAKLDEAIKALRANGTIRRDQPRKYFKYDIYGG